MESLLNLLSDPAFAEIALGALAGLMAIAHLAEVIVKLTPTKADDEAVGKITKFLRALLAVLPSFGKKLPLALVFATVATLQGCSSIPSQPSMSALDSARGAAVAFAGLTEDADIVRRAQAADFAIAAVRQAVESEDDILYQAAAPCAVAAIDALLPDVKHAEIRTALNVVSALLKQAGGTCDVDSGR